MSQDQSPVEELKQEPELSPEELRAMETVKGYDDDSMLLLQYQALLDRSLRLIPLLSSNGFRRVFTGYLKAGVHEVPKFQDKIETELFNAVMQLHDIKYSLIVKAIDSSAKQAEQEIKEKEGEQNEQH